MIKVIDKKPIGGSLVNNKPSNLFVSDIKPTISKVYGEVERWREIQCCIPMGLLLTITYPVDQRMKL